MVFIYCLKLWEVVSYQVKNIGLHKFGLGKAKVNQKLNQGETNHCKILGTQNSNLVIGNLLWPS